MAACGGGASTATPPVPPVAPQTLDINGLASGNGFLRVSASTGHILKITPPPGSGGYHFGATVDIAAIDDNGRGDILIAASLKRVGGELLAQFAPAGSAVAIGANPVGILLIIGGARVPK